MQIVKVIACASIVVILAATLMIPAIDSASEAHEQVEYNNGFQRYSLVNSFEITDTVSTSPQINGKPLTDYVNTATGSLNVSTPLGSVITNKIIINFYNGATATNGSLANLYIKDGAGVNQTAMKVTLSNGTIKLYNVSGEVIDTLTGVTYCYLPDKTNGQYIAADAGTTPVYFDKSSTIVQYTSKSVTTFGVLRGTYNHMVVQFWSQNSTSTTTPTTTLSATAATDKGSEDLYTITVSNPVYVIVPYTYTSMGESEYYTLLHTIPIVVFAALAVMAVGAFYTTRGRE